MAEKENRRTRMTKHLLRTALLELMQKKSISQITIRELCEQADLNRTTFYLHYTDQTALLRDTENEVLVQTREYMKNIHTDRNTIRLVQEFLEYIKKDDLSFRTLLCRDDSEHFRRRFVHELREIMAPDLPEYGTPRQTQYTLIFLMFGILYLIIEWIENDYKESTGEISRLIFQLADSVKP